MRFRFTPSVLLFFALAGAFALYFIFGADPTEAGVAFAESEDRDPTNAEFGVTGMRTAALVGAVLSLLIGIVGGFTDRSMGGVASAVAAPREAWTAGAIGCLILLMLAGPRMNHSLWQDEATTVRRCIAGQYRRANEQGRFDSFGEQLRHREVKWSDTLWEYRTPNNQPLFSISARLLNNTGSRVEDSEGKLFSEPRIRLPSLLAGLGMIILAPLVAFRLGGGRAAVILAPILIALSPMVVRWSSEARGYGMGAFFAMAMLWSLLRALDNPRWGWWILFGLCQFAMLYAYPNWAFTFFLMNAAAFLFLIPFKSSLREHLGMRWRLTASSTAAGMGFLFLFLPNYLNFSSRISANAASATEMGWEKVQGLWSYLSTARVASGGSEWMPGIADITSPLVRTGTLFAAGGLLLAALAGVAFILCSGKKSWWIALPLVFTAPFAFLVSKFQGVDWFYHYLTFLTPMVVLLAALGLGWTIRGRWTIPGTIVAIALYGAAHAVTLRALIVHPSERNREAAQIAYDGELPDADFSPAPLHAGLQQYTRNYDPWIIRVKSLAELERVIALAREREVPLHVQFGQGDLTRQFYPEATKLLEGSGQFEKVATLYGTNHDFDRHVFRLVDAN